MATDSPPATPTALTDRPTYKLVASRLGTDPLEFIRARRGQTPPVSFVKIRDEMLEICNRGITDPAERVELTHEVPRRWLMAAEGAQA